MKRQQFFILLLAMVFVLVLAACAAPTPVPTEKAPETAPVETQAPAVSEGEMAD